MTQNININTFAKELSEIIAHPITFEHIHPMSEGRFYYTQAPDPGAPLLLNHYRGPFFVDIHPDDYRKIADGEVSPHDYIYSANWLAGYYWGGGSMIGGGYYKPFDIINHKEELRKYFGFLSCRGNKLSSCSYSLCNVCPVKDCPYNRINGEITEDDPRLTLFAALRRRFENQFPGYTFRGFLCTKNLADDTILLCPNGHYSDEEPFSFIVYASDTVIKALLMRKVTPEDWDEYVKGFKFKLHKMFNDNYLEPTQENVQEIFTDCDYAAKKKTKTTEPETDANELLSSKDKGIIAKLYRLFTRS